jgi:hypothetical protein
MKSPPKASLIPIILACAGIFFPGLSSCSSTKTVSLSPADAEKLKSARICTVQRAMPPFSSSSFGQDAIGNAVGIATQGVSNFLDGPASIYRGRKILREYQITDPAEVVASDLVASLATAHNMKITASVPAEQATTRTRKTMASLSGTFSTSLGASVADESPKRLAAAASSGADYVLDVRTADWSIDYFLLKWNGFRVNYAARLRLIDARTGETIAKGFYERETEKSKDAPARKLLLKQNAAVLKTELALTAKDTATHFKQNVLALAPPGETKTKGFWKKTAGLLIGR